MNKKRFIIPDHSTCVFDKITKEEYVCIDKEEAFLVCKRLNKQQDTIQQMKHSLNTIYKSFEKHYGYDMRNAVWLIDELSYDEFEDKLHIEYDEQKSIIEQLQKDNKELKHWKKRMIEYLSDWFNKTEYLTVLYKINEINNEIGLDIDE